MNFCDGRACGVVGATVPVLHEAGQATPSRRRVVARLNEEAVLREIVEIADRYDMRGVSDSLDPEDRAFGLLRWKLGTGGELVQAVGEWERALPGPINQVLLRATTRYRSRR